MSPTPTQPPLSPISARCARHIVTHPERFLHLPEQSRAAMYARCWQTLHRARHNPAQPFFTVLNGGAA